MHSGTAQKEDLPAALARCVRVCVCVCECARMCVRVCVMCVMCESVCVMCVCVCDILTVDPFNRSTATAAAAIQSGTGIVRIQYHYYDPAHPPVSISNGLRKRKKKIMMVLIIGGTSLLEVAAFRCLSVDPSFPYSVVIGSTDVVSGDSWLKSLYHD
jgi:hypothetical protein